MERFNIGGGENKVFENILLKNFSTILQCLEYFVELKVAAKKIINLRHSRNIRKILNFSIT